MYAVAVLCFSHYKGGMELDALKATSMFCRNGVPSLLLTKENTFIEHGARRRGIKHESIRFTCDLSWRLISGIRQRLKRYAISNVVFFGTSEIKSIYFATLGLDCNVNVRYGTTMSSSKKDPLHRLFYSCVSNHIAVSRHISRSIDRVIPRAASSNNVVIYPHYLFPGAPAVRRDKGEGIKVTHVGRIAPGKGQLDAVRAFGELKDIRDISLHFLGEVADNNYYASVMKEARNDKDRIFFAGFVDDVYAALADYDIFLFPSHGEGLSNALVEALATGLVCITYDNSVFPEVSDLGFYLHQVTHKDTRQLAARLRQVASEIDQEKDRCTSNVELCRIVFSEQRELSAWRRLLGTQTQTALAQE